MFGASGFVVPAIFKYFLLSTQEKAIWERYEKLVGVPGTGAICRSAVMPGS
jgi:hypothetical protein